MELAVIGLLVCVLVSGLSSGLVSVLVAFSLLATTAKQEMANNC